MTTFINVASRNTTFRNTTSLNTASTVAPQAHTARLLRHLALKWDLYGVLTLMASTVAYGVFALAQVA